MPYGYGYGYYFDPTYILVLIGVVISLWASAKVKTTYSKYSRVRSMSGLTGAQVADQILRANGHLRCAYRACQRRTDRSLRSEEPGITSVGCGV